jgi:chaperonin GroEL
MEYNNPSEIVKDLTYGEEARGKIMLGVEKLTNAVKSTLGASGKCVIYEDALGRPVITKDGVTVAESVVLIDPVENIGATLIKEAAANTVRDAGDGTTTATVLAHSLLKEINNYKGYDTAREIKGGIDKATAAVMAYLDSTSVPVKGKMLRSVASISCNNDKELGEKIGDAYERVGADGVVMMEESETNETYVEFVDGVQFDSGLKSQYLVTDRDKMTAVLDKPYVLIVSSPLPNIRKIQNVLEHIQKTRRSLLIVAEVDQQPYATLLANKVKGNIKVNIVDPPGFGATRLDTLEDLAFLTGATLIDEAMGDDLDLIDINILGEAVKAVTDNKVTVLQIDEAGEELAVRVEDVRKKIKNETNSFLKKKLEQRLAMLSGKVGIIKVGADSKVELKEKKDRVEDAIYATKAALKEGIVAGGGVALLDAALNIKPEKDTTFSDGETLLLNAIKAPFFTILDNGGVAKPDAETLMYKEVGKGIDVTCECHVDMITRGIIDPVLVTKSALKNAVSVVTTIVSADCVISNMRINASN